MALLSSMKSKIADRLLAIINGMTGVYKYTAFDFVKLTSADFKDYELPACQIIDNGEANLHEQSRGRKTWNLLVEIVVGPTAELPVSQKDLWDLMQATERALFTDPQLGIDRSGLEAGSSIIQMTLVGSSTDLHFMTPYYLGRLELAVEYYQPLVRPC